MKPAKTLKLKPYYHISDDRVGHAIVNRIALIYLPGFLLVDWVAAVKTMLPEDGEIDRLLNK